ncbi:MAG TPA: MBL fold metallo-hydrolase [Coriobacteriia bacterium]|nr:MBL fold metallo-hydrolase [Coriobacteriia bacterium]
MKVERIVVGPLEVNCWIVSDGSGGPAVVIDPGDDACAIEEALAGREVAALVLTHGHFDHIGAVRELKEATGAQLLVHEADAGRLSSDAPAGTGGAVFGFAGVTAPPADRLLADGDVIKAGAVTLTVLHTPGHTQGGICLLGCSEGGCTDLFSGDTLFAGSVGRTDFVGGDGRVLARSIAEKLAPLEADVRVHPGHGPDTTIGREQRINPFWPRA